MQFIIEEFSLWPLFLAIKKRLSNALKRKKERKKERKKKERKKERNLDGYGARWAEGRLGGKKNKSTSSLLDVN